MTAKSSRTLPFIVLGIVVVTLVAEEVLDTKIDLESYLPLLIAIGIGGAAKSAITKAAAVKTEVEKVKLVETIKEHVGEVKKEHVGETKKE